MLHDTVQRRLDAILLGYGDDARSEETETGHSDDHNRHQMEGSSQDKRSCSDPAESSGTLAPFIDQITVGNCITELKRLPSEAIHLITSDIPYGIAADHWDVLHDNTNSALLGSSPAQKNAGAIFKSRGKPINGWSEADREIPLQYQRWVTSWAAQWFRILKPGASAFIFAGRRFSHRCVCAMEDAGFSLKDMLAWERPRAAHRAQRLSEVFRRRGDGQSANQWQGWKLGNLRPTFEPILWFVKPYTIGGTLADNMLQHGVGAYNDLAFSKYCDKSENVLRIGPASGEGGLHPTQKPVRLMQALVELASQPGQIVLDPFAGSGTTAIAATLLNRRFIVIEQDPEFARIACERLLNELPTLI